MRDAYTQLKPMPIPVPRERSISAIERRFPHIARELSALWQTGQIGPYLDSLLIDNRGGRKGFPADALDELMFLSGMRWHLLHQSDFLTDSPKTDRFSDRFSFAAENEADIRRSGSKGAWVLV